MLSVFFNTTFNAFMKGMKYTLNVSSSYHRLRHEVELVLIVPIDSHPVIKCKNVFPDNRSSLNIQNFMAPW